MVAAEASEARSGRRAATLVLFVRPGCRVCEEVEDWLHEHGIEVERRVVRPSPFPGQWVVSGPTGIRRVPRAAIPGVPAIWMVERGELHVGDAAIRAAVGDAQSNAGREGQLPAQIPPAG